MHSHAGGCGGSPAPVCRYIPSSCSWKASSKRMCRFVRRNPKSARTRFRRFMINCSFFDSSTGGFQRSMRAPRGEHEITTLAFCRSCRANDRNHWDINVIGALAVQHGQVETKFGNAKITCARDLLRFLFLHVGAELPLRQTVALIAEAGGPSLSPMRLHMKLRHAEPYLHALV